MAPHDPLRIAENWFDRFSMALGSGDTVAITASFLPDGWFRDILVFGWDFRSLEGRAKIQNYLTEVLGKAGITNMQLDKSPSISPRPFSLTTTQPAGVELAFTFDLPYGACRGHARLLKDSDGEYRALTAMMSLSDLREHEETLTLPLRDDVTGIPGRDMQREYADWVHRVETDPFVLVVGAAQTGLQVAARLKQNGLATLVIDRLPRVGDSWRVRYPTLTLHTPRKHTTLLYQPYPTNWPQFAPRDKFADWLEHYASIQDLTVWTGTEIKEPPTYDPTTHRWTVNLYRSGTGAIVSIRPAHIVLATGTIGRPSIPAVPNLERFHGRTLHSSAFPGGGAFSGQHAVVIGAGNSAVDIAQDLSLRGAASVTMVQRSRTCVVSRDFSAAQVSAVFPEGRPLEACDLAFMGMPLGLFRKVAIADREDARKANATLQEKLRKAGVAVDDGPEGQGPYLLFYERAGGYWLDKGGADLIADGRIAFKSGVTPGHFTDKGLVLSDGTELPADLVVFATGYQDIRESTAEMMGEAVMRKVGPIYKLDEEGELRGSYRPCGHPGLWFATGDIPYARIGSKALALQIKALELGLIPQ